MNSELSEFKISHQRVPAVVATAPLGWKAYGTTGQRIFPAMKALMLGHE